MVVQFNTGLEDPSSKFREKKKEKSETDAPRIIDPGQDDVTMAEPDDSSTKDKP